MDGEQSWVDTPLTLGPYWVGLPASLFLPVSRVSHQWNTRYNTFCHFLSSPPHWYVLKKIIYLPIDWHREFPERLLHENLCDYALHSLLPPLLGPDSPCGEAGWQDAFPSSLFQNLWLNCNVFHRWENQAGYNLIYLAVNNLAYVPISSSANWN